jgi:simple sugar transport system permease protein
MQALAPVLAAAACLLIGVAALASLGYPPADVLGTVWEKVLWRADPARRLAAWENILRDATPILLTGLAIVVAFRASVWNIGGQGQFLGGALAANAIGAWLVFSSAVATPLLLLGAMAAGGAIALIAATLDRYRRVPVVLSTLLLNAVMAEMTRFMISGPMRAPARPGVSLEIVEPARLPLIAATNLHVGFLLALAAAGITWFILARTTFGFRLRAVGENADAARAAGISVGRVAMASMALSGALAGLAGGVEVSGVRHELALSDASSAFGFTGIAVALLGRLSAPGVVAAAIFFGILRQCFFVLEAELSVSSVTGQALQGLIILLMLVLTHGRLWRTRQFPAG